MLTRRSFQPSFIIADRSVVMMWRLNRTAMTLSDGFGPWKWTPWVVVVVIAISAAGCASSVEVASSGTGRSSMSAADSLSVASTTLTATGASTPVRFVPPSLPYRSTCGIPLYLLLSDGSHKAIGGCGGDEGDPIFTLSVAMRSGEQFKIWRAPTYDTGQIVSTDTGVLAYQDDIGTAGAAGSAQLQLSWAHCLVRSPCVILDVSVTA
jgi:hypothetical protein